MPSLSPISKFTCSPPTLSNELPCQQMSVPILMKKIFQLSTKFVAAEKNLKNMENKVIELEEKGKDKKELESILELKSKEIEALKYGVAKMSTEKDSISSAVDKMKAILRFVQVNY